MITRSNAMLYSLLRPLIIVALAVGLAGCSALRLGYSQGPTLAYWWADRHLDFDDRQAQRVREGLRDWFAWNRQQQLSGVADMLARAQRELPGPTSAAQLCRWNDELVVSLYQAYEQALPAMAEVALSLQPAQLKHLEGRYQRSNADFKDDFLQPQPKQRLEASVKRAIERAETLYGRLDDAQRSLIARGVAASPFDGDLWMAERLARQQDVLGSLRRWTSEASSTDQVRAGLRTLAQQTQSSHREPYRAYQQRLLAYNCQFAADIHNATTPAQRQQAVKKLKGWEQDLRALAADKPA
jgi:hypothetical protein